MFGSGKSNSHTKLSLLVKARPLRPDAYPAHLATLPEECITTFGRFWRRETLWSDTTIAGSLPGALLEISGGRPRVCTLPISAPAELPHVHLLRNAFQSTSSHKSSSGASFRSGDRRLGPPEAELLRSHQSVVGCFVPALSKRQ